MSTTSQEQFPELLANLVARYNEMLSKTNYLPALGLVINKNGDIEVVLGASKEETNISEQLSYIQNGITAKADKGEIVASCISYPDYESNVVVALLENIENYCGEYHVPVLVEPELSLDIANTEELEGKIYIFPEYVE